MLKFDKNHLLDEKLLGNKYRTGKKFAADYLKMNFENPLNILLIQDDLTDIKIPKPYNEKIGNIYKVITKPEIEILMVHHFDLYLEFKKKAQKPSDFLANYLKMKSSVIKSRVFIEQTFTAEKLAATIRENERTSVKIRGAYGLSDLLK